LLAAGVTTASLIRGRSQWTPQGAVGAIGKDESPPFSGGPAQPASARALRRQVLTEHAGHIGWGPNRAWSGAKTGRWCSRATRQPGD